MVASIFSRKRDFCYLVHFTISIPITFMMDLQAIYPPAMVPSFMKSIKAYYIETYKDKFFVDSPDFFKAFIWSELLIQAPVMIWAISALLRNSPKLPIVLLPFATLICITTITCMFDYMHWPVPIEQKIELTKLYGPYVALSAFMAIDMCIRLNNIINRTTMSATTNSGKKQQ